MPKQQPILSELFFSFMKVGLFTFGGGYAMISVITDTCVEKKQWLTEDEMMDLTVVAESTPGPIAINCATYVGYKMAGMTGAVLATLGIVLPSFVILYIISMFLEHFLEYPVIAAACRGIKIGVSLLILDAGLMMLKKMKKKPKTSSSVTRIPGRIPLRSFRMFTIYRIRSLNTISLSLRLAVTYGI